MYRLPVLLCALVVLAGCTNNASPERFLTRYADPDPTLDAVTICHGYGCARRDTVDLRLAFDRMTANMARPASDAASERANIALTIGAFEAEVGAMTDTAQDVGGTFEGFAQAGQLDCIDETSNTTTYLTLLDRAGLLVWHEVRGPMSRFFVHNGWPHTTAVIVETATGQAWAVDSWFHGNGQSAEVVPLEDWIAGWAPQASIAVASSEEPEETLEDAEAGTDSPSQDATMAEEIAEVREVEPATATPDENKAVVPAAPEAPGSGGVMAMTPVVSDGDPEAENGSALQEEP